MNDGLKITINILDLNNEVLEILKQQLIKQQNYEDASKVRAYIKASENLASVIKE